MVGLSFLPGGSETHTWETVKMKPEVQWRAQAAVDVSAEESVSSEGRQPRERAHLLKGAELEGQG